VIFMTKKHTSQEIIAKIEGLTVGQSVVYYRGMTGWMYDPFSEYGEFVYWLERAYDSGKWDFTQRKVSDFNGIGVFEYIATKRSVPKKILWVVDNNG
jgi:hypothetical protein